LHPFPPTRDAVFQALADKPMLFPTGASERYTQTNFLVIEAVLEAHYKQPYRQIVTERILQPLGMHDTFLGKSHVPPARLVRSYRGENDQLAPDVVIDWPEYSIVHTEVYTTIDDFGGFLEAVCAGRLVRRETLLRLWKPYRNATGGFGQFAAGWEYDRDPSYHHVGHDGGTKVRVRVLFDDSLSHNVYIVVYWTNGSAANVWSRKLVDSVMDIAPRYER
jgi:CubicO group peptidase (beta-lactamase class C family)